MINGIGWTVKAPWQKAAATQKSNERIFQQPATNKNSSSTLTFHMILGKWLFINNIFRLAIIYYCICDYLLSLGKLLFINNYIYKKKPCYLYCSGISPYECLNFRVFFFVYFVLCSSSWIWWECPLQYK